MIATGAATLARAAEWGVGVPARRAATASEASEDETALLAAWGAACRIGPFIVCQAAEPR